MLGAPCKSQSCSRASFPALGTVSLPMAGVWKQMIFKIPSNSMIPSSPALLCSSRLCHLPCPFLQGLPAVILVLGISIFFFFSQNPLGSSLAFPTSFLKELCVIPAQRAGNISSAPRRKVQAVLAPCTKPIQAAAPWGFLEVSSSARCLRLHKH